MIFTMLDGQGGNDILDGGSDDDNYVFGTDTQLGSRCPSLTVPVTTV
ncbi:MAG: hypothetical protein R3C17_21825 [Planctomycetaceae bacterium]